MSNCMASQVVPNGCGDQGELFCYLFEGHTPPIHWDHGTGIHWFRMEEQPGMQMAAALPSSSGGSGEPAPDRGCGPPDPRGSSPTR